uniref:Uncharacterized protein n=1 Tax=Oryza sativa subsp. japonica TaxID=39947 RepID=Q6EQL5_ORYSJ|nr:hypothetical protein [Oryza sativa Japonica Group]
MLDTEEEEVVLLSRRRPSRGRYGICHCPPLNTIDLISASSALSMFLYNCICPGTACAGTGAPPPPQRHRAAGRAATGPGRRRSTTAAQCWAAGRRTKGREERERGGM